MVDSKEDETKVLKKRNKYQNEKFLETKKSSH